MMNITKLFVPRSLLTFAATIVLCGCSSAVVALKSVRPIPPATIAADIHLRAAGEAIADARRIEAKEPLTAVADYLSAVQSASERLRSEPQDSDAMHDYNFALSRVFSVIHDHNIPQWTTSIDVKSPRGVYHVAPLRSGDKWSPADFEFVPVDNYRVGGTGFAKPVRVEGLGAPLVAIRKQGLATAEEKFLQSGKLYFSDTAVARFDNHNCDISVIDPLQVTNVTVSGHSYTLAADYSTSTAMLLADQRLGRLALTRLFHPGEYDRTAGLSRLQPYSQDKIPVLFIHGLSSTPETWMPMFNGLTADPEIRRHYQFWFYSYPSGYPYFYSTVVLRRNLDAIKKAYPNSARMVVVGHSMGSLIARLLITDSGDKIWNAYFKTAPAATPLQPADKNFMEEGLIFKHRSEVAREVFIAGPHRGSDVAMNPFTRAFNSLFVHLPPDMDALSKRVAPLVIENPYHKHVWQMPTSINTLTPTSRFVHAINSIPSASGIPYHQIMGDRGRGDTPNSSDGVVPYWSSHLEGAQSEVIVPSNHYAHENPQAIEEVIRILKLNLRKHRG
jgi:pimeloyl-ACP methyl ester carboxylesterase